MLKSWKLTIVKEYIVEKQVGRVFNIYDSETRNANERRC